MSPGRHCQEWGPQRPPAWGETSHVSLPGFTQVPARLPRPLIDSYVPPQDPVQDSKTGGGEEEPRMGPGEEGTPPSAGQVSAGGADCGLGVGLGHPGPGALLPPGSQGFIVHFPEPVLFFPPLLFLGTGRSALTPSTPAASASPASEQVTASTGTPQKPHGQKLCNPAQALASADFSILKCLLQPMTKSVFLRKSFRKSSKKF